MKRIMLFLATNLAVVLVLSVVLNIVYAVTGMQPGSLSGLLVMAAVFGFGGAFISLMMSKGMALRSVGGMVIESPRNETEHWLVETVGRQAQQVVLVCQRWLFMIHQISMHLRQVQNEMTLLSPFLLVFYTI